MTRALVLILAGAAAGCPGERVPGGPGPVPLPRSARDSPLFVHFPELDHRVVEVDPDSGRARQTYYPDSWDAEAGHLLDFAVDRRRLYALVANRRGVDLPRLLVVDRKSGRLERALSLPAWPQSLAWDCAGRLWVGHATPSSGPGGRVTLVDTGRLEVLGSVPLQGGAVVVVPHGAGAFVVERAVRESKSGDEVFVLSTLAEVDAARGEVTRRRSLPPGAREASLGPSGQLYVAHTSGPGDLATDGTVSVVDRQSLEVVRRLRLDMAVRSMVPTRDHLALNMLSRTGEVWVAVVAADDSTLIDFRLDELVGPELVVLDGTLHIPMRRDQSLTRVPVDGNSKRPRLLVKGAESAGRGLGLVRTWMSCDGV